MAIELQRGTRDPQRVIDAIVQLGEGRQNSVGDVTLRANQATTVVTFPNCSSDARVFLFPQTANAAAALATTFILKANILRGSFTISHANNAQADKTFSFLCIGG
jgi:hypothetical protein